MSHLISALTKIDKPKSLKVAKELTSANNSYELIIRRANLNVLDVNEISNAIEKNTIIVSEKKNEVVGFIWFNITNKSFYGLDYGNLENHYMFISYIWVIESSRNKGIAMQLYERVINYAKEHHIKKIWLDIYMSNEKSIHFHNKLGFQPQIMLYSKDI